MQKSLFIKEKDTKNKDTDVLSKIKKATKVKVSREQKKKIQLLEKIEELREYFSTQDNLSQFKCVQSKEELFSYVERASQFGLCAIDTETDGLDTFHNEIVGFSMYCPTIEPIYVPINHRDPISYQRLENQLTLDDCLEVLKTYKANTIMYNAIFDTIVFRRMVGVNIECYWDCLISAKLLNENEPSYRLKDLHNKYISNKSGRKSRTFKELFDKINFALIPIDIATYYASNDALITYELYSFHNSILSTPTRKDLLDIRDLMINVEMPALRAICNMIDIGFPVDLEKAQSFIDEYRILTEQKKEEFYNALKPYQEQIDNYIAENSNCKIKVPINPNSAVQISELLYKILNCTTPNGTTGEEDLLHLDMELTKKLLEYRHAKKILSTYLEKIPLIVHDDGCIHSKINPYGAVTGRMSSSGMEVKDKSKTGLNLQNIPANKIRTIFIGGTSYEEKEGNSFALDKCNEVMLQCGKWKFAELLQVGDILDDGSIVTDVKVEKGLLSKVYVNCKKE